MKKVLVVLFAVIALCALMGDAEARFGQRANVRVNVGGNRVVVRQRGIGGFRRANVNVNVNAGGAFVGVNRGVGFNRFGGSFGYGHAVGFRSFGYGYSSYAAPLAFSYAAPVQVVQTQFAATPVVQVQAAPVCVQAVQTYSYAPAAPVYAVGGCY